MKNLRKCYCLALSLTIAIVMTSAFLNSVMHYSHEFNYTVSHLNIHDRSHEASEEHVEGDSHSHTHKHSEGGEEHTHKHLNHITIAEMISPQVHKFDAFVVTFVQIQNSFYKEPSSTPYTSEILRPPISA